MDNSLISQGVELMLFGMGTVLVFLTLLVIVTAAMSALVQRYFPPPEAGAQAKTDTVADATLLAVISAAIHRHRSSRSNRDSKS